MDLNYLYSQHQISLIGAASTSDCSDYARHVAKAGDLARQIHDFHVSMGASAADSQTADWFPSVRECEPSPNVA